MSNYRMKRTLFWQVNFPTDIYAVLFHFNLANQWKRVTHWHLLLYWCVCVANVPFNLFDAKTSSMLCASYPVPCLIDGFSVDSPLIEQISNVNISQNATVKHCRQTKSSQKSFAISSIIGISSSCIDGKPLLYLDIEYNGSGIFRVHNFQWTNLIFYSTMNQIHLKNWWTCWLFAFLADTKHTELWFSATEITPDLTF